MFQKVIFSGLSILVFLKLVPTYEKYQYSFGFNKSMQIPLIKEKIKTSY